MTRRHRPDRRGNRFEESFQPEAHATAGPVPGRLSGYQPETVPPVRARVKWFNMEKGFGFVELDGGGGDAFLHSSVVERGGCNTADLQPYTGLLVRVGTGQKGPQIVDLLGVDEETVVPDEREAELRGSERRTPTKVTGTVKWYNPERGYGFVTVDGKGNDVFVHASALQRSRIENLTGSQRVRLDVVDRARGPEAVSVNLIENEA